MIELDALLRDYQLGLVLIAGGGRDTGAQPVQWVHSSDLVDPTPFLTPRTVLLTTGTQFVQVNDDTDADAFDQEEADAYVQRLIRAGATALGIAVGVRWERIPPPLIEACDRLHLPLFRVPYDVPFIAIVRTAARLLDAELHAAAEPPAIGWGRDQAQAWGFSGRREQLLAAERALRGAVLQLLTAGQRDLADRVAAAALPPLPRGSVAVVHYREPGDTAAVTELASLTTDRPGVLAATDAGRTTVVVEAGQLALLRRALARLGVAAGVSERGSAHEVSELLAQAERAHELALRQPDPAPLTYAPAMHAGVLQVLHDSAEAMRRAVGLLAPVREHDRRHDDAIERSLTVWLAHHGQTSPASAALGVHRHTLRNRVQTAASLLQLDLDNPDARAELWAALRLAPPPEA